MKKYMIFVIFLSFFGHIFANINSGCELPDYNIYLSNNNEVFYNTSSDIGGFQFNIDNADLNSASGGDAADAGFFISTSATTVLAFSL